jgi:carbonic anhydrase
MASSLQVPGCPDTHRRQVRPDDRAEHYHDHDQATMSDHVPIADEFLAANRTFAVDFPDAGLQVEPTRHVAIVACMDSRMDMFQLLGLGHGEAHVIRNAGGVITDDVIRSICLSQRFMKTREVVLVHHTDCGLEQVTEDSFRSELQDELGVTPPWVVEAFTDPHASVHQSMQRLHLSPFLAHKDHIRGFVYCVTTGLLDEVTIDPAETAG